jgi:hypothetical protein
MSKSKQGWPSATSDKFEIAIEKDRLAKELDRIERLRAEIGASEKPDFAKQADLRMSEVALDEATLRLQKREEAVE